jgi:murein peptide amidase A
MRNRIKKFWSTTKQKLTKKVALLSCTFLLVSLAAIAFWPKGIAFSFAGTNCFSGTTILPRLTKSSGKFTVTTDDFISLKGYPILGQKVCLHPNQIPEPGTSMTRVTLFGIPLPGKNYQLKTAGPPKVNLSPLNREVAANMPLELPLSETDRVFTYNIAANSKSATCAASDRKLICPISELALAQGAQYEFVVSRHFKGQTPDVITKKSIKTVTPVSIIQSSVAANQVVYDKPKSFVITADKPLKSSQILLQMEGAGAKIIPVTPVISDKTLTINLNQELTRDRAHKLTIQQLVASDGSTLAQPYAVPFTVSGGPKVTGTNIASYGVAPGATVVVNFDQPIKPGTDINKFISFIGGAATITTSGSQVFLKFSLPQCSDFSVAVKPGLISNYDIVSTPSWQFKSRTRCHTISTISASVKGRAINAYTFGTGSSAILMTGAVHGNEKSSKYLLDSLITDLEIRAREIPAERKIVVVPNVNPDGFVANSRFNSSSIDLNRNFPSSSWTASTPNSGSVAGSEPETKALMSLASQLRPRLVITYHSKGSLVNSNDTGIAASAASSYSQQTGYKYVSSSGTAETFGYPVTGTYEDWLSEQGLGCFLVELPGDAGNYFSSNRNAIWTALKF